MYLLSPRLSVVICSLNGAVGLDRCLRALAAQTIRSSLEFIVVDDGSTDNTSDVARAHGTIVIRHVTNCGTSISRNSGVNLSSAPIVAFLDDDCEPEPQWAENLLAGYDMHTFGVGGPLLVGGATGFMLRYLARHNPLDPQELTLAKSDKLPYRLYLYLRRQWLQPKQCRRRAVFSLASANMSVRRQAFLEVGGFDKHILFAGEDEDLCRRLRLAFPTRHLIFTPDARVIHHFKPSIRDTLRRSLAYGYGAGRMYCKWSNVRPTFFPWPVLVLAIVVLSVRFPALIVLAVLLPHLFYPGGLRAAFVEHRAQCLLDAYVQLAEEACADVGFLQGLWRFRHLAPEPSAAPIHSDELGWEPKAP